MNYKTLYIVFHNINTSGNGIAKKIRSQVKAFNNEWGETSLSYLSVDDNNQFNGRLIDGELIESYKDFLAIPKKIMWRFKFDSLLKYIKVENIKAIYIRYTHFANPFFISFLKKVDSMGIYIMIEIPTFPYDFEYDNAKFPTNLFKRIEECYRTSFKKYVDLIITFSNEREIFGVKTLKINNGIDIESLALKTKTSLNNEIHLLAVASMEFWHGYDRLIEGLNIYYKNSPSVKVFLHLVGNPMTNEAIKYKQLVNKYHLKLYVNFHGFKSGELLNKLFDKSDVAIGCLGVHRKGIKYIKSLKNSEYCARGIPFIYSEIDETFENESFILKVPANEEPIDIKNIIKFHNTLKTKPQEIRKFAKNHLTWDKQVRKILATYLMTDTKEMKNK